MDVLLCICGGEGLRVERGRGEAGFKVNFISCLSFFYVCVCVLILHVVTDVLSLFCYLMPMHYLLLIVCGLL